MKFNIERKKFLDALAIGASMAGKAKTIPILECAKCRVKEGEITIVSTDIDCWVMKRVELAFNDEDFEFCVNPSDLIKAIKSINDDIVSIEVLDSIVSIKHLKGTIEFPSYDYKSFPTATKGTNATSVTLKSELLFKWIDKAKYFVSNDDLRPIMNGMYIYIKDGKIGVCATDAHKLFTDFTDFDGDSSVEIEVTLANRAFPTLMNMINGTESVTMTIDERNVSFASTDAKISCRLIEGNYPNFRVIIPLSNDITVETPTKELIGAISRVSMFTNSTTTLVKLGVKNTGVMSVSGQDINFNKKAEDECTVFVKGDDIEIGVKGDYMATCLNAISNEVVKLEMTNSTKPIVFKDSANPNCTIILMPMLLSN